MKSRSGEMIPPKFGEYKYYHDEESKPEHILFWVHDTVEFFLKRLDC